MTNHEEITILTFGVYEETGDTWMFLVNGTEYKVKLVTEKSAILFYLDSEVFMPEKKGRCYISDDLRMELELSEYYLYIKIVKEMG